MAHNNDKQDHPVELSEEQLCKALVNSLGTNIILNKLEVIREVACGNYSSDIYRVTMEYTKQNDSVKNVHLVHILVKDLLPNLSRISNEYLMYAKMLPMMNKTLAACNIAPVAPFVHFGIKSQKETHYFEDLSVRDYKVHSRFVGYGEEEALLLLKRLGHFHAASLIFNENHPASVGELRAYYAFSDPALMDFVIDNMRHNIEHFSQIAADWPGYSSIIQQLNENLNVFRAKFTALFDLNEASIKLVTHGDLWINNILLHTNAQGAVDDAVFLDYQTSFLGSPAFDIHNLLMTSVQLEVLEQKYEVLIAEYYAAFSEVLRACAFDVPRIPTLAKVREELRRTDYYNYYLLTFPFAQTMLSDELAKGMGLADFSDEVRMKRNRDDIYSNKRVLETYKYMLKQFELKRLLN